MRLTPLLISIFLIAVGARPAFGLCSDFRDDTAEINPDQYAVEYFEEIFESDLSVVGTVDNYKDPDQFFTAVAREVGILDLAEEYIVKNFADRQPRALLRYSSDCWVFLMFSVESTDPSKIWTHTLLVSHDGTIEETDGGEFR